MAEKLNIGIELEMTPLLDSEPDYSEFYPEACYHCGHEPEPDSAEYEEQLEQWLDEWQGADATPYLWERDVLDTPEGWELTTDCSCGLEYRFDRPTPLAAAGEMLLDLVRQLDVEPAASFHGSTGLHVHLDCRPDQPVYIVPEVAWDLWRSGWWESAWELCVDQRERERTSWCVRQNIAEPWSELSGRYTNRQTDFNITNLRPGAWKRTIELRMWEATTDQRLNKQRLGWLLQFIHACLTEAERRAAHELVSFSEWLWRTFGADE